MKLTCTQMDVLISFYIENELSKSLKQQVEDHLKNCRTCRAKYDIIKSMITDLQTNLLSENVLSQSKENIDANSQTTSSQYRLFKNNLSAYIDNELSNEENVKIKKFTINNSKARQDLEENYTIKKMMNNSFNKTKNETKHDFTRSILRQLELEEEVNLGIHPLIKMIILFTLTVLVLSTLTIIYLNM